MSQKLHYRVIYKNGDRIPIHIADLIRTETGRFVFEYQENPRYEFPGFDISQRRYESDALWDQIAFRIPNVLRNSSPNTPLEELLIETEGKLITDHFEFELVRG